MANALILYACSFRTNARPSQRVKSFVLGQVFQFRCTIGCRL